MTIDSNFAILDVKKARAKLRSRVEAGQTIPVVIHATITDIWGADDGVSQEFELEVKSVEEASHE